jgi:uncharacterized membrane protein YqjE
MQQSRDDRSLGELFADLSRQTSQLIHQEVTLAKTEMTDKATRVGKNLGFVAAGGVIVYAGFLALLATIIILLAKVMAWWLSALIVGVVVVAIGAILVNMGLQTLKRTELAPHETIDSLKEDKQWMKEQI